MLKELFINMTILVTFISLGSQFIKGFHYEKQYSLRIDIVIGILFGALGCILMLFSVNLNENILIDFRYIAIITSATFGGAIPVILTGLIISIFRMAYFGLNMASILGVISAVICTIGCVYIKKLKIKRWIKWMIFTIFAMVISNIVLIYLLWGRSDFLTIIVTYWLSNFIVSAITFWFVEYNHTANSQFFKLQRESVKDFLTGLNNPRQFDSIFNKAIKDTQNKNGSLSLLMIDIDFFKKVNDTYGHPEGDIVLKELSKILNNCCGKSDVVSRNGGEEFSILLLDCSHSLAQGIAEEIRKNVQKHNFMISTGQQISITVSIGVASYPENTRDIEKLIEKADMALYKAKRSGRNTVCA